MSLLVRYPDSEPYRSKVAGGKTFVVTPDPQTTYIAAATGTFNVTGNAANTIRFARAATSELNGLAVYYKLENVNDSSVNGLNLTDHDGVTYPAGKIKNAAQFSSSGAGKYLTHADNAKFQMGTGSYSISAWVKFSANPSGLATVFQYGSATAVSG